MTKSGKFPTWGGGENIANFDLVVGNDHAVDEQLDELTLLVKGRARQASSDATTEILKVGQTTGQFKPVVDGRLELVILVLKGLALSLEIGMTAPVFIEGQDVFQIGLSEPFQLVSQLEIGLLEILLTGLEFLRQPGARLSTEKRLRQPVRMGE